MPDFIRNEATTLSATRKLTYSVQSDVSTSHIATNFIDHCRDYKYEWCVVVEVRLMCSIPLCRTLMYTSSTDKTATRRSPTTLYIRKAATESNKAATLHVTFAKRRC